MSVLHLYALLTHDRLSGGSVVVLAGIISKQGKMDLYIIQNATLTAARYISEISDVYVRLHVGAIAPYSILMDDNARPHRARVTNEYLQTATIDRMDWQARPSDLSAIKHACEMLQTAISARQSQSICRLISSMSM